jgi:hypothetical protein
LIFWQKKNKTKIETNLSQVNGKLTFEEKASEEAVIEIPAFSEANFSIRNYDGVIIEQLEIFAPFHRLITYSGVNRIEKGQDEYVIVTISATNKEAIGYFK